METKTVDQVIESVGVGRFQYRLLVICGFGWAADAMEVLLISFALPAVGTEWKLSNADRDRTPGTGGALSGPVESGRGRGGRDWRVHRRTFGRPHGLYHADGDLWRAHGVVYPDLAGDSGQTLVLVEEITNAK